ncbi:cupin domain-containing protein [Paenibacillus tritici]|jgi:quercetin dioxygenase-like cupin family protein|uniref:Cupin domain-containing protein n=1 Tax=Paenibacillus tritici TaxID=1873425 RepID=A0ABX2DZT4_9BACL|nr:cupin domain-containing protein [Paenibacillus tritici]NQX49411.1 cupin domain-containing protein [Paenibacillus tritici]QUL54429.1 cupin domain-containing protein [Paenibacillus tritici]
MEKKNIAEVIQYQEERFTKKIIFQKGESVVFVLNFMPGQKLPVHKHPGADVYILALHGDGVIHVNEEEFSLVQGETIYITGDESFAYTNNSSSPSSLHVVLSKLPSADYAKEI